MRYIFHIQTILIIHSHKLYNGNQSLTLAKLYLLQYA